MALLSTPPPTAEDIYSSHVLGRDCFRLLRLSPGPISSPVCCHLSVESLDTERPFEALSYTWGDPDPKGTIRLCGHEWSVTTNLLSALRDLRSDHETRILWVDALCINQKDNSERNHQVALMSSIYRRATRVVAWLGAGSAQQSAGIDAIQEIARAPTTHWYAFEHDGEDNLEARNTKFSASRWDKGIGEITTCSWWSRVWTLQEALLARELLFLVGRSQISSEALLIMSESWVTHSSTTACCKYLVPLSVDGPFEGLEAGITNVLTLLAQRREREFTAAKEILLDIKTEAENARELALDLQRNPEHAAEPTSTSTLGAAGLQVNSLRDEHDALIARYEDFVQSTQRLEILKDEGDLERKSLLFEARDQLRDRFLRVLVDHDERLRMRPVDSEETPHALENIQLAWRDMLRLVDECQMRDCSDPRDRVYGYFGLRSHLLRFTLPLDYSFPCYKAWEDFQLEVIHRSRSLDILNLLGPWNADRDVLSWLVNWRKTMTQSMTRERFGSLSQFRASGATLSQVQFIYPSAISISGFVVGTVQEVGAAHMVPSSRELGSRAIMEWWRILRRHQHANPTGRGRKPIDSVFCEMLMAYSSAEAEDAARHAVMMKHEVCRGMDRGSEATQRRPASLWRRLLSKMLPSSKRSPTTTKASIEAPPEPLSRELYQEAVTATGYRQLIVSKNGHVGLANTGVTTGDIICILFGGRTPFILREVNDGTERNREHQGRSHYRLVGEAYIHGLMHGEGLEMLNAGGSSPQDFLVL